MSRNVFPPPRIWRDPRQVKVLGMGAALPGPAVSTAELLERVERRFGVAVARCGRRWRTQASRSATWRI